MTNDTLWNHEQPIANLDGITVPPWIKQDITGSNVAAIIQGGCASGAYMPAVTYYDAAKTMDQYGDEILDYIQNTFGELPKPADDESWTGMAVFYLSTAVETWAAGIKPELTEAIENQEAD